MLLFCHVAEHLRHRPFFEAHGLADDARFGRGLLSALTGEPEPEPAGAEAALSQSCRILPFNPSVLPPLSLTEVTYTVAFEEALALAASRTCSSLIGMTT